MCEELSKVNLDLEHETVLGCWNDFGNKLIAVVQSSKTGILLGPRLKSLSGHKSMMEKL